jgi:hypothetical protein
MQILIARRPIARVHDGYIALRHDLLQRRKILFRNALVDGSSLVANPADFPTDLGHERLTTQNAADRFKAERVFADASMVVDPLILIDISEMIRDAGYYVAEATSGDEAFAFLETPGSLELQTRSRRDDGEDPPMSPSSLP